MMEPVLTCSSDVLTCDISSNQNDVINLEQYNNLSSLMNSGTQNTFSNYHQFILNTNNAMESTPLLAYNSYTSMHDSLNSQNALNSFNYINSQQDNSVLSPMDSGPPQTFSNCLQLSNVENAMGLTLSPVYNPYAPTYTFQPQDTFINSQQDIPALSAMNSELPYRFSNREQCANISSFLEFFLWPGSAISKRDIKAVEQILSRMKIAYEGQTKINTEIPKTFLEKISPNCNFYLPKYIKSTYNKNYNWKQFVRDSIFYNYPDIGSYSATGRRSNRPSIDRNLFNGLFEYINSSDSSEIINKTTYTTFINKLAANQRKYMNQRHQQ